MSKVLILEDIFAPSSINYYFGNDEGNTAVNWNILSNFKYQSYGGLYIFPEYSGDIENGGTAASAKMENTGHGAIFGSLYTSGTYAQKLLTTDDLIDNGLYLNQNGGVIIINYDGGGKNTGYQYGGWSTKNNATFYIKIYLGNPYIGSLSNSMMYASTPYDVCQAMIYSGFQQLNAAEHYFYLEANGSNNGYSVPEWSDPNPGSSIGYHYALADAPCGGAYIYGYLLSDKSNLSSYNLRFKQAGFESTNNYDASLTYSGYYYPGAYGVDLSDGHDPNHKLCYLYKYSISAPRLSNPYSGLSEIYVKGLV